MLLDDLNAVLLSHMEKEEKVKEETVTQVLIDSTNFLLGVLEGYKQVMSPGSYRHFRKIYVETIVKKIREL